MDGMSKELRRFNYLMGEIDAAYHEAALNLGLSDSAMRILYVLCGCGSFRCSLREVCLCSGLSKQALAEGTVARLIAVEDAILGSWPAEDVEKYLSLAEQYLTAFREKAKHLGNR